MRQMEDLKTLLESDRFLEKLVTAARVTYNKGYETGFGVYSEDGSLMFSSVILGGVDGFQFGQKELDIEDNYDVSRAIKIFSFHFHPDKDMLIIPSEGDLRALIDEKILYGIGEIDRQKNIEILLYMPKLGGFTEEELDDVNRIFNPQPQTTGVAAARMRVSEMFDADVINLKNEGHFRYGPMPLPYFLRENVRK